jgi:hypothetical protein
LRERCISDVTWTVSNLGMVEKILMYDSMCMLTAYVYVMEIGMVIDLLLLENDVYYLSEVGMEKRTGMYYREEFEGPSNY